MESILESHKIRLHIVIGDELCRASIVIVFLQLTLPEDESQNNEQSHHYYGYDYQSQKVELGIFNCSDLRWRELHAQLQRPL